MRAGAVVLQILLLAAPLPLEAAATQQEEAALLQIAGAESRPRRWRSLIKVGDSGPVGPGHHPGSPLVVAPKRGLGVGLRWYASSGQICRVLERFHTPKSRPWFYNWAANDCPLCDAKGSDYAKCTFDHDSGFVPMYYSPPSLKHHLLLADAVLGFNEPNTKQLTPEEAASQWREIEEKAASKGIRRIGSPAPGGAGYFAWLDAFFDNCEGCKVDFVTAHIFKKKALGTHSLQSMLASIHSQYGVPIWLTEFNAGGLAHNLTAIEQLEFMEEALPLLEHTPYVERYAWYAVCNDIMPTAALLDCNTMELTDLGMFYRDYDHSRRFSGS